MSGISRIYPMTTGRDALCRLTVAGHALSDLARLYGTPLYVYDGETVRKQVERLRQNLRAAYPGTVEITYAAKAYFSLGFARKLANLGIGVDVVSLGELNIARRAGFSAEKIHLHGNNKSQAELSTAVAMDVQAIVVDSLEELAFLEQIAEQASKRARVWLRITPGLTVDTHPYRQTAHASSKFGLPLQDGQAAEGIRRALASKSLELRGLHMHLGSQIFEDEPYRRAISKLLELAESQSCVPVEISPGGGWGVPYTPDGESSDPEPWIAAVTESVVDEFGRRGWPLPKLIMEPGRWIAARAGMALYSVGTTKTTADGVSVVAVDGGMADNPRPALYHTLYTACLADRPDEPADQTFRIVGKFCETGDELIPAVKLPVVRRGDVLAMPVAGAYQLSMASNYNLAPRPAVLWLEEGSLEIMQPRETVDDSSWWTAASVTKVE